MGRWQPDGHGRLQQAALALFERDGYAATTVAAIAGRAGLTERTFYRHFPDKRDVLFGDEDRLEAAVVAAVAAAPEQADAATALALGLRALAAELGTDHRRAHRRARVIASEPEPELAERELGKLNAWSDAIVACLSARGTSTVGARLAAELAMAVFRNAFHRWTDSASASDLSALVDKTLDDAASLLRPQGYR